MEKNDQLSEIRRSEPQRPNWAYLATCCAFSAPAGCAATGLAFSLKLYIMRGHLGSYSTKFPVTDGAVFCLSIVAFSMLVFRWRKFCAQSSRRQILTAIACWMLPLVGLAYCIVLIR
jgi:hypothetical protein